MQAANDKIIVEVDFSQKKSAEIGGTKMYLGKEFSSNRRESMPVVCMVVSGNQYLKEGDYILVHHNRFAENSPHHIGGNYYSLACNQSIFGRINSDGTASQLYGNIFVERIVENKSPLIPEHLRKVNKHKFKVLQSGYGYKEGRFIFCYEHSDYEIVYVFEGKEHRIVKVYKDDIVGKLIF